MSGFGKKELLGKICHKITDGTHKTPAYQDSGIVFLSAKNIKNGTLSLADHKYISEEEHLELTKRCKPEAGDVMLSKSGSLGDAITVPNLPFSFSIFESLALIKPKRDILSAEYLQQYLNSPLSKRYFWSITSGIAVKHLHLVDLRKMPINLPSLAVQAQITGALEIWDDAIEKTEALIAAKEKQFEWLTSNLINRAGHKRTSASGLMTEVSKRNKNSTIERVLSVTNHSGFVLPEEQFERRVASANVSNYKVVEQGQYAYNPSRINVGSIARLDDWENGILSPMYVVFKLDTKKVCSDYFLHWLNSSEARQRIKNSAQGSVRETVSFKDLGAIDIPMPAMDMQKDVTYKLNLAQKEISLLKNTLEQYRSQKRGLMQKLLTGEWQVSSTQHGAESAIQGFSKENVA